jgi:hypothetical protein
LAEPMKAWVPSMMVALVNVALGCEYFYNRVTFTNHKINFKYQNGACKIESDEVVKWREQ